MNPTTPTTAIIDTQEARKAGVVTLLSLVLLFSTVSGFFLFPNFLFCQTCSADYPPTTYRLLVFLNILVFSFTFLTPITALLLIRANRVRLAGNLFAHALTINMLFNWLLALSDAVPLPPSFKSSLGYLSGTAIFVQGILTNPYAAFGLAALNSLIILAILPNQVDLPNVMLLFWWLIAVITWRYETTLHRVFARLAESRDQLETLVDMRTEQLRQRTEELSKAKEEAEAANRAKSLFLANMSHELRTPLNAILGFTQVLERQSVLSPEQRDNLTVISRSGEHLLQLINDVLDVSKIEAGRITLSPSDVDLYGLLATLKSMVAERTLSKGLILAVTHDADVPHVIHTDEGKLRQILLNLLINAIKFTDQGSIRLHARLDTRLDGSMLVFDVSDTGHGIAPTDHGRIFESFVQTRESDGTGLGLAISRQFARLMGGDITVQSALGSGAVFTLTIPLIVRQKTASSASVSDTLAPVPAERLQALSPALLADLRHMASMADAEASLALIAQIDDQEVAAMLRSWVSEFRFDRIMAL
jgi:signal transduction histidine kinase